MGTGIMPIAVLLAHLESVREIPGDVAEIGVWRGDTFQHLAAWAAAETAAGRPRMAHAFDSFVGLAAPGPHDDPAYRHGRFGVGGPVGFKRLMDAAGVAWESYSLWPGYVPECFLYYEERGGRTLAFCAIDLDHYQPTRDAIAWAWPRIAVGGILALDDVQDGCPTGASRAVSEWLFDWRGPGPMGASADREVLSWSDDRMWVRRTREGGSGHG